MRLRVNFENTSFRGERRLIQTLHTVPGCGIGLSACPGKRQIVIHSIPPESDQVVVINPCDLRTTKKPRPAFPTDGFVSTTQAASYVRAFLQSQ